MNIQFEFQETTELLKKDEIYAFLEEIGDKWNSYHE